MDVCSKIYTKYRLINVEKNNHRVYDKENAFNICKMIARIEQKRYKGIQLCICSTEFESVDNSLESERTPHGTYQKAI